MRTVEQIIADAETKPYKLGEHDCLRVACQVVAARVGIDYWPRFAGYKTKRQALARIASIAPSLREAITKTLGIHEVLPTLAQRGDIVLYRDVEEHIGVCMGENVVVLGPDGLVRIKITSPMLLAAWRLQCQPQ
jgi:hypothetical protein